MLRIFERMQTFRRSLGLLENALPLCWEPRNAACARLVL